MKKIKNTAKEHAGTLGYQAETKSSNCKHKKRQIPVQWHRHDIQ